MIAEKYRSLSRWTRKMSELWLVNELDEKCSKQERLLIIIWILWFQVWHKYRNNNILTSLREWLIFTCGDRVSTNTFLKKKGWKSLIYWGFRHREQSVPGVMGALFLCLRELVKEQGRGYDFTISENGSTILLFWAKRENDFTIARFEVESGQD